MSRKIRFFINTDGGCILEELEDLPEDWDRMTEDEQENFLEDEIKSLLDTHVAYGAYVVEED